MLYFTWWIIYSVIIQLLQVMNEYLKNALSLKMKASVTAVICIGTYPEQSASSVDGCFGKQLAGKVKVSFGLDVRQRDCENRGQQCLASCPGSKLLHSPAIILVKVEGPAGRPRFHVSANWSIKRHHRKTMGVDQRDGVVEELGLCRDMWRHLAVYPRRSLTSKLEIKFMNNPDHFWCFIYYRPLKFQHNIYIFNSATTYGY